MLRATVFCTNKTCDRTGEISTVRADNSRDLEQSLAGALVGCHAIHPSCALTAHFEEDAAPVRPRRDLVITCLAGPCELRTVTHHVPIELVGAMTLLFHTAHEGHPLRLEYDGEAWESPLGA